MARGFFEAVPVSLSLETVRVTFCNAALFPIIWGHCVGLFEHWLRCYELFNVDKNYLRYVYVDI